MDLYTLKDLDKKSRELSTSEIASFKNRMVEGINSGENYDVFFCHPGLNVSLLCTLEGEFQAKGFSFITGIESKKMNDISFSKMDQILPRCQSMIITDLQQKNYSWQSYHQIGYFACLKNRIAVLPILKKDINTDRYSGEGIFALYPYVGTGVVFLENRETLWVLKNPEHYVDFEHWLISDPKYVDW
jgi:hypothetical protein